MDLGDKTPIEHLVVEALRSRRKAEAHEAAAKSKNVQLHHFHTEEASFCRTVEAYFLDRALKQAALFLDAEDDQ